MNETSPSNGNENQSSFTSTNNPQSKVPINGEHLIIETTNKTRNKDDKKVPTSSEVLSNVDKVKLYESSISDSSKNEDNLRYCDQVRMSPVEGPVNDAPKTMFDTSHDKQLGDSSGEPGGCEQFSGQIVFNPDGSAYIMEENDETLLEQIPRQEGSIVERGGKCLSEVEYPRIDQVRMIMMTLLMMMILMMMMTRRSTLRGGRPGSVPWAAPTSSFFKEGRTLSLPMSTTSEWSVFRRR